MKQTLRDIDLYGKRILIRVDFNVPQDTATGRITDDTRIRESLPTIRYCLEQGGMVILMSHLGRPKATRDTSLSLKVVAERLGQLIGRSVLFLEDCVGQEVATRLKKLHSGEIALLENLRFHPEEEKNDPVFAQQLAQLGEIYVNDAFGSAHRAHASTEGVAHYLPAVAGFLMEKEIRYLQEVLTKPTRPFVAILGGSKVSDKIGVLKRLLEQLDTVLIGGGMCYTFLKAQGMEIGSSKLEADKIELAKELLEHAHKRQVKLLLPIDHVITTSLEPNSQVKTTSNDEIPEGWLGADIGPRTTEAFTQALIDAKTVVWNGPVGVFEQPRFCQGSQRIAETLADLPGATTIIGGGDTAACIQQLKLSERMSHISTGGGAALEFLEGKILPGIAILRDSAKATASSHPS